MDNKCPKCNADNVLVGNNNKDNKCSECGHKWEHVGECSDHTDDHDKHVQSESIVFKSPEILLVYNHNIKRNKFSKRLDEALSRV